MAEDCDKVRNNTLILFWTRLSQAVKDSVNMNKHQSNKETTLKIDHLYHISYCYNNPNTQYPRISQVMNNLVTSYVYQRSMLLIILSLIYSLTLSLSLSLSLSLLHFSRYKNGLRGPVQFTSFCICQWNYHCLLL